jgi:hypothetical protein
MEVVFWGGGLAFLNTRIPVIELQLQIFFLSPAAPSFKLCPQPS